MKGLIAGGVLATAFVVAAPAVAADAGKGKAIFDDRCTVCHSAKPGEEGAGPSLAGVVGRRAASDPGFPGYTAALKKSGLTWSRASLDKFLSSPSAAVPGTAMPIALPDKTERDNVIAYLATLHGK